MKELSIEEKAKAYDEAIERYKAKQEYESQKVHEFIEYLFPELKESEDERIRKEIIAFLIYYHTGQGKSVKYDDGWIAWLEKQGENNMGISEATKQKLEDNLNKALEKETAESYNEFLEKQGEPAKLSEEEQNKFAKGVLTSCALSFINYLDAHKYKGKMCVSNGECEDIENAFHNAMWDRLHRYYCKYIEKQGEQKPAGKTKPKFKVGDIITPKDGGHEPWQIIQVDISDKKYRFKDGYVIHFSQEDNYELVEQNPAWSEEDEIMYKGLHNLIYSTPYCDSRKELSAWLKSLKDRVQPKPQQEWDGKSAKIINDCISAIHAADYYSLEDKNQMEDWLKSLRPQNKWKPSDEQMKALGSAIHCYAGISPTNNREVYALEIMKEQLKKLRDE